LPIEQQNAQLIPVNAFWRDFAAWMAAGAKAPFLSSNFTEAHRNFAEIMFALAVLDLPFEAAKHSTKTEGPAFTLTTAGPVLAVHKQIKPAAPAPWADGVTGLAELLSAGRSLPAGREREVRQVYHRRIPRRCGLWREHRGDQPDFLTAEA
jgi:hypothetical protein